MVDTEWIMTFRSLCLAMCEKSALPGFYQDPYVLNVSFAKVPIHLLIDDFVAQRMALLSLIRIFPADSTSMCLSCCANTTERTTVNSNVKLSFLIKYGV